MRRTLLLLMLLVCTVAYAATTTTNYSLYKPAVGDVDWGALVNTNFDTIDTQMKANADDIDTNDTATALNTTHRSSNGTDHANVVTNTSNIATNVTAIGLNTTHRTSDGSDHSFIDQDVTSGSSPTLSGANITGIVTGGITDGTILEADLNATNAPTDNYILSYNTAGTNFTWIANSSTDDQTIDVFTFDGTSISLSLEGDGEATKTLDISSVDTNTNASTICTGTGNYLDGEGNCDALVTNATHTGDVTGSGALTIASDAVDDTMINWGTAAGQVSTDDVTEGSTNKFEGTTAGDYLTLTGEDIDLDAEVYTKTIGAVLESPTDDDSFLMWKAPYALTITDIECITGAATSAVIDIQECTSAGATCATVDATITCDSDGASDDGTLTNGAIDSGDWINLDIGTVTGTVGHVAVTVTYTPTD